MDNKQTNKILIIRLAELMHVLIRKIWAMVLVGVLFAVGGYGVSTLKKEQPMYVTTSKVYVTGVEVAAPSSAGIALGKQVLNSYIEILKSGPVLEQVIEKLELNMSVEQLRSCISVNIPSETSMLEISVMFPEGEWAKKVADELVVVSATRASEIMGCTAPIVYEEAKVPTDPYNVDTTSWILYVLAGGVVGVAFVGFMVVVRYFANSKFTNPYKVSDRLRMKVLGAIPNGEYEEAAYQNFISQLFYEEPDAKVIGFVSATEKENKHEFMQKAAEILKKNGKKVILLDANITNPKWGAVDTAELNKRGLEEYLRGEVSLEDIIATKDGIAYIHCKEGVANGIELLLEERFSELITSLEKEYDYIYINTSPANYTHDAVVVADNTQALVLVVSENAGKVGQAKEIIDTLSVEKYYFTGAVLKDMNISKDKKYMCKEFGKYFGVYE